MNRFFKKSWAIGLLVMVCSFGIVLSTVNSPIANAETQKEKATRWVNEFSSDCKSYTIRSGQNDKQDERCAALKQGLTAEPISCSSAIVDSTVGGSGRGGAFSRYTINEPQLASCKKIINNMKEDASSSEAKQAAENADECKSKSGQEKTDCIIGFVGGYNGEEKAITCAVAKQAACEEGYDAGVAAAPAAEGKDTQADIPCIGGALGWVMCPIINYMADGIVAISTFIDGMMQFKLLIGVDSGNAIHDALNNFVGLANIILVIAFLIIIFSQSTSLGLSNYNIKKMLPRIVLAAIMINLSFYICALAIDISNIFGNSIMGLITGQGTDGATVTNGLQQATKLTGPNAVQNVFGAVMGAAIGVVLLILFLSPLLLGVLITFVILVARQVILLFLVVTAPLAFAAWLLPNTESYFKKWKDLFVSMLMAYPIVMLVFGVALFAAKFISQPAIQNTNDTGLTTGAAIGPLITLVVLAIPLLALPFILRQTNTMLSKIGSAAQKYGGQQISGKAGDGLKKAPGIRGGFEMMEQRKTTREAAFGRAKAKRGAKRVGGLRGAVIYGGLPGETTKLAKEGIEGQAAGVLQGLEKQEIENARAVMHNHPDYARDSNAVAMAKLRAAHTDKDQVGVRAAVAELSSNAWGVKNLQSFISEQEKAAKMDGEQRSALALGINDNWSAVKSKDAAVAKWSNKSNDDGKAGELDTVAADGATYSGLKADELSSQTDEALGRAMKSEYVDNDGVKRQGVAPETAQAVLASSDTQKNLTGETRPMFNERAGTSPPPPSQGGTTPPPSNNETSDGGWNTGGSGTTEGEIRFKR